MPAYLAMARPRLRWRGRVIIAMAIVLTTAAVALSTLGVRPHFTVVSGKDIVAVPRSELPAGALRFFAWRDDAGREIRFILGSDDSGRVQGAFDACQQCSQYRKGYTESRGYLVCRFCGNRYRLDSTAGFGSCAPVKLPVHEGGATVSVNTADLASHGGLF